MRSLIRLLFKQEFYLDTSGRKHYYLRDRMSVLVIDDIGKMIHYYDHSYNNKYKQHSLSKIKLMIIKHQMMGYYFHGKSRFEIDCMMSDDYID